MQVASDLRRAFNLQSNPKEQVILANHTEHKEVLNRYRSRCQKLVQELAK